MTICIMKNTYRVFIIFIKVLLVIVYVYYLCCCIYYCDTLKLKTKINSPGDHNLTSELTTEIVRTI